jgi:hypothetical protein
MFKYSLKELFYWSILWAICLSALAAVLPSHFAVAVTLWLIGTVVISKGFGSWAALGYSIVFGFDFYWVAAVLTNDLWMSPTPVPYWLLIARSIRWGLINGSLIWAVATAADYVFRGLTADYRNTVSH